jgi:predicted PurR-regulated permease PerM
VQAEAGIALGIALAFWLMVSMPKNSLDSERIGTFRQNLILVCIAIALIVVGLIAYFLRWVILFALIGIGLGVILAPAVQFLKHSFKIPRGLGVVLLLGSVVAVFAGTFFVIGLLASHHLVPAVQQASETFHAVRVWALKRMRETPWLDVQETADFQIGEFLQEVTPVLLGGLQAGFLLLGGIVFVIALAAYSSVNPSGYVCSLLTAFPARTRPHTKKVLEASAKNLRQWLGAQLLVAFIVAILSGLGLWVIGLEAWLLIAMVALVAELIPFFGPIAAWAVAALIALGTQPNLFIWVTGWFIILQQLESNLITPVVFRGRMKLPPVHLLVLMVILGSFFGLAGVFVTPAIFAVGRTIYLMTYVRKMDQLIDPSEKARPPEKRGLPKS